SPEPSPRIDGAPGACPFGELGVPARVGAPVLEPPVRAGATVVVRPSPPAPQPQAGAKHSSETFNPKRKNEDSARQRIRISHYTRSNSVRPLSHGARRRGHSTAEPGNDCRRLLCRRDENISGWLDGDSPLDNPETEVLCDLSVHPPHLLSKPSPFTPGKSPIRCMAASCRT